MVEARSGVEARLAALDAERALLVRTLADLGAAPREEAPAARRGSRQRRSEQINALVAALRPGREYTYHALSQLIDRKKGTAYWVVNAAREAGRLDRLGRGLYRLASRPQEGARTRRRPRAYDLYY